LSIPAEFVKPLIVDAEVMSNLVENGDADLALEFFITQTEFDVRLIEDRDLVRGIPKVVDTPIGERDTVIEAEKPLPFGILIVRRAVLDNNDEIVDPLGDPLRQFGENRIHDTRELPPVHRLCLQNVPTAERRGDAEDSSDDEWGQVQMLGER